MDRVATTLIVTGVLLAVAGIVTMGGTTFGQWFSDDFRGTATYMAAAAPVLGLALLGMGGSRVPQRTLAARISTGDDAQA